MEMLVSEAPVLDKSENFEEMQKVGSENAHVGIDGWVAQERKNNVTPTAAVDS